MDLRPYIDDITRQLAVAAEAGGDEARAVAERLVARLESAIRLALQDALAAAAEEITVELVPGSVEVRLRGRDPEFVVTQPPADPSIARADDDADERADGDWSPTGGGSGAGDGDDGSMVRINLRLPDRLKTWIEEAANRQGVSVNAWIVRAAALSLERSNPDRRHMRGATRGSHRYTGWVR